MEDMTCQHMLENYVHQVFSGLPYFSSCHVTPGDISEDKFYVTVYVTEKVMDLPCSLLYRAAAYELRSDSIEDMSISVEIPYALQTLRFLWLL